MSLKELFDLFFLKHMQIMRKERHTNDLQTESRVEPIALICDKTIETELSECALWPVCQTTNRSCRENELNECARWSMCQTTHCARNQTEREWVRSVANVPNNPYVTHSYLTLSCLLHLHMSIEDHKRLYCLHIRKPLNSLIYIKIHLFTLRFVSCHCSSSCTC